MPFENLTFDDAGAVDGDAAFWVQSFTGPDRIATYGDGEQPAIARPPFEAFRGGWDSNQSYKFAFEGVGTDLERAIYNTTSGGVPEGYENFESGWDNDRYARQYSVGARSSYNGRAFVQSRNPGPYALTVGDTLSVSTSDGGPVVSDPIAAVRAEQLGAGATYPTGFLESNRFRLGIDDGLILGIELFTASTLGDVIGRINSQVPGAPVAFDNGGQLALRSPSQGTRSRVLTEETDPARAVTGSPAPYALVDGQTLIVAIDGGAAQTLTFNAADFPDIGNISGPEMAEFFEAEIAGATSLSRFGSVQIISETINGSSVEITGGTAAAAFDFPPGPQLPPLGRLGITPADVLGTGNVGDLASVAPSELSSIINETAAVQGINAEARAAGGVRLYSEVPETGTVEVQPSPLVTALDIFPTAAGPTGIPASDFDGFEVEWGNSPYARDRDDITLIPALYGGTPGESFETGWGNDFYARDRDDITLDSAVYYNDPNATPATFEGFQQVRFDAGFTATPATNTLTTTAPHGLVTDTMPITVRSTERLPDPLTPETTYFPVVVDATSFQLKEQPGATPVVDIDDGGTGRHTLKYPRSAFWTEGLGI